MAQKAVVILSGGLDSTTCMGIAHERGYELFPLTFDYGQRSRAELESAKAVARFYRCEAEHQVIDVRFLGQFGGSALTDEALDVPLTAGEAGEAGSEEDIPITYVPGRNLMFLSMAASYAEAIGAEAIFIGVNDVDYSGYPDCRPQFIAQFAALLQSSTKVGAEGKPITVEAPIISLSKADIIRTGVKLGVPYHLTQSCYAGGDVACGQCDSCRLRLQGFAAAGLTDPIRYK